MARDREYGELENDLLRDHLVCGISDDNTRSKLLQVEKLTLQRCINICKLSETSTVQMATLNEHSHTSVNAIQTQHNTKRINKKLLYKQINSAETVDQLTHLNQGMNVLHLKKNMQVVH